MENIADILNPQSIHSGKSGSVVRSERAELIKFFVDTLKQKNKKPFSAKMIAIKLSHIPTKDLYYMISVFKDAQNRKGLDYASKWFWHSLKPQ